MLAQLHGRCSYIKPTLCQNMFDMFAHSYSHGAHTSSTPLSGFIYSVELYTSAVHLHPCAYNMYPAHCEMYRSDSYTSDEGSVLK